MFEELDKNQGINSSQPIQPSSAMPNIPKTEPQDIFANVDNLAAGASSGIPKPPVFQPKQPGVISSPLPGEAHSSVGRKKIMLVGFIVIAVSLLFAGLWYGYYILLPELGKKDTGEQLQTENQPKQPVVNSENTGQPAAIPNQNPANNTAPEQNNDPVKDDKIGNDGPISSSTPENNSQPASSTPPTADTGIDTDNDGLTDAEEAQFGTDPKAVDSDNDGLFDREELKVYKSNPLDPDTDKDGFSDGAEVKSGYDPNGPGKLYNIKN